MGRFGVRRSHLPVTIPLLMSKQGSVEIFLLWVQDFSPRFACLSRPFKYFRSHLRPVKSLEIHVIATLIVLRFPFPDLAIINRNASTLVGVSSSACSQSLSHNPNVIEFE
jgi:hypothetical protein